MSLMFVIYGDRSTFNRRLIMMKELYYRGMSTTQIIDKLKQIADSAQYCEIEGYLSRAICLLEQYKDEYDLVHGCD